MCLFACVSGCLLARVCVCVGGGTVWRTAVEDIHLEVVALLLGKGAQVDLPTKQGWTPLGISAEKGHAAVARLLLQYGADPLHRTNNGDTPLSAATPKNHADVGALLRARIAELAATP